MYTSAQLVRVFTFEDALLGTSDIRSLKPSARRAKVFQVAISFVNLTILGEFLHFDSSENDVYKFYLHCPISLVLEVTRKST